MTRKLTIVLPLKDRAEFTARFLRYANPSVHDDSCIHIIAADGGAKPQVWLKDNLDVDYFHAGYDSTLQRWWGKMVMAFDRVETPYAMVADNDDMLIPAGIASCIDFLERNPGYIACSGRIQGFHAWPDKVLGPHFTRTPRYALYDVPADYGQSTANLRVLSGFQNSWSYYAVYRTEALRAIWTAVRDLDLTNLQVHEKFCAMKALSLGKIKCDGSYTSYLRQIDTSAVASKQAPFHERYLSDVFSLDRDRVFSHLMAHSDVDIPALRMLWAEWFRGFLLREYGPWPTIRKALKRRMPRLAWVVQNRHRWGLA